MKKILILSAFIASIGFCKAQNMIALNKLSFEKKENEWVLLSPIGKVIKTFTDIDFKGQSNGMICALDTKINKFGYISLETGNWEIPAQFEGNDYYHNFSEGLLVIPIKYQNGTVKSVVYNKKGKMIFPPSDWTINDFSDGMAVVEKSGYQFGAIDNTGKLVIPFSVGQLKDFHNGIAIKGNNTKSVYLRSSETGLWGFVDKTGKMIINQEWSWIKEFSEGFAAVQNVQKKWGFIDLNGKLVIPCTYDGAENFSEAAALVKIRTGNKDQPQMTYIDKKGKRLTDQQFEMAENFVDGMSAVIKFENQGKDNTDYTFGFVDKNFKLIIPMIHHKAIEMGFFLSYLSFSDGLCPTSKGYIDKMGKLIISFPEFEHIQCDPFSFGTAFVTGYLGEQSRLLLINKSGKILWKSDLRDVDEE